MYAIVSTGGKQYRVERGQSLLIERLPVEDGGNATLRPLLYVDGDNVVDGDDLAKVTVQARVVGHERGPKLRVVKFKPKRGYKRRTGHRQELTRIEVTEIKLASRRASSRSVPKPVAAQEAGTEAASGADAEATAQAGGGAAEAAKAPPTRSRRTSSAKSGDDESQAKPTRRKTARPAAGDEAEAKPATRGSATQASGDDEAAEAKPAARPRRKPTAKPEEEGNGT